HLGTITEIGVFRKRFVLPTPCRLDRSAAPDTGGPVKIKKPAGKKPAAMLDHEMAIKNDGLYLRQERIFAINMPPPHLHHTDCRVAEIVHNILQKIRRGYEIGIKDCNQLTRRQFQTILQCARFEAIPVLTMDVMNIEAALPISFDAC